jgi:hypothetical protein
VGYATKAAARTNPSRPIVNLPQEIVELRDLPHLLRMAGHGLIGGAGSANLSVQFGINPIAGALAKLFFFRESMLIRMQELKRLAGERGLRRTVRLDSGSSVGTQLTFLETAGFTWRPTFTWKTSEEVRGHVRWKSTPNFDKLAYDPDLEARVVPIMLGFDWANATSTAWELLPWSWLIDWVTNLGDYLSLTNNAVGAELVGTYIMRHTLTEYSADALDLWYPFPQNQGGWHATAAGPKVLVERKRRYQVSVIPSARLPFLDGNQVGILASLLASRGKYSSYL